MILLCNIGSKVNYTSKNSKRLLKDLKNTTGGYFFAAPCKMLWSNHSCRPIVPLPLITSTYYFSAINCFNNRQNGQRQKSISAEKIRTNLQTQHKHKMQKLKQATKLWKWRTEYFWEKNRELFSHSQPVTGHHSSSLLHTVVKWEY